jgi:hypothetical protein
MAAPRRFLELLLLGAVSAACGGSAPTAVPAPVTPIEPLPALTTMQVVAPADSIAAGQAVPLNVQAFDQKSRAMTVGLVTWASSDSLVARMAANGVLLCLKAGQVTISATVGQVTGRRVLTLTPRPPGPLPVIATRVTPISVSLEVGQVRQLSATMTDFAGDTLTGRDVAWSSANDSIATVSSSGVVTAKARGSVLIDAASDGVHGATLVVVSPAVDSTFTISVPTPLPGIEIGDTATVVATVRAKFPIDSVTMSINGRASPMTLVYLGKIGDTGPAWVALADVSAIAFGANFIIVTAYGDDGKYTIHVVPFSHNPRVNGGSSKPPSANK